MKYLSSLSIILILIFFGCNKMGQDENTNSNNIDSVITIDEQFFVPEPDPEFDTDSVDPSLPDNSYNSLDWVATYKGVLFCEDCDGIETILTLNRDQTYFLSKRYLGNEGLNNEITGKFKWNLYGGKIKLDDDKLKPMKFLVGEDSIFLLDETGNRVTGKDAGKFILNKVVKE